MRNGTRRARAARLFLRLFLVLALTGAAILAWTYAEATSTPVIRQARYVFPDWPGDSPPIKVLLISDIHVAGPDMPPERLSRIVRQINGLAPDVVLIAGDLVSDKTLSTHHYSMAEAIAPLAGLKPKLGSFAVLGNHDYWRNAAEARAALATAKITLLSNRAVRVGPVVMGGADDPHTRHADADALARSAGKLRGPALAFSHSPDVVPQLDPRFRLVLAGHTHCGQIVLPLIGRLATASNYGERYACGIVRENGRTIIVSAGLGTSMLPLRMGAPPDMWLLTLSGQAKP